VLSILLWKQSLWNYSWFWKIMKKSLFERFLIRAHSQKDHKNQGQYFRLSSLKIPNLKIIMMKNGKYDICSVLSFLFEENQSFWKSSQINLSSSRVGQKKKSSLTYCCHCFAKSEVSELRKNDLIWIFQIFLWSTFWATKLEGAFRWRFTDF
jgi:hypothetical protein